MPNNVILVKRKLLKEHFESRRLVFSLLSLAIMIIIHMFGLLKCFLNLDLRSIYCLINKAFTSFLSQKSNLARYFLTL